MCCGGQGTAGQVDMVGGAKDEHTLPGRVENSAISTCVCEAWTRDIHVGGVDLPVRMSSAWSTVRVTSMTSTLVKDSTL